MRRLAATCLAAAALAGCGGGDDDSGSGGDSKPASAAIATNASGERIVRDAFDAFRKGRADLLPSLQQDLRENDEATLVDDLWDFRNVIYRFDQALRRVEFAAGRPENLSIEILEINRAAIARIDPILDAKEPPPGLADAVERAASDAEAIEQKTEELLAPS